MLFIFQFVMEATFDYFFNNSKKELYVDNQFQLPSVVDTLNRISKLENTNMDPLNTFKIMDHLHDLKNMDVKRMDHFNSLSTASIVNTNLKHNGNALNKLWTVEPYQLKAKDMVLKKYYSLPNLYVYFQILSRNLL